MVNSKKMSIERYKVEIKSSVHRLRDEITRQLSKCYDFRKKKLFLEFMKQLVTEYFQDLERL